MRQNGNWLTIKALRYMCVIFMLLFIKAVCYSQDKLSNEYGSGKGGFFSIYQKHISPVKGGNQCPMYPSCSQYAKIEFANNNPAIAYFNVCDRLIRCGNDLNNYPTVEVNGRTLFIDSVKGVSCQISNPITNDLFIKQLENEKDYQSSILEYKRLLFFEKDSSKQINNLFRLAICYYNAHYDKEFSEVYRKLKPYSIKNELRDSLAFYQSLIYFRNKDYLNADFLLSSIKAEDNMKLKSDVAYLLGVCLLQQHDWLQSEYMMKQVIPLSDNYSKALNCYNLQSEYNKMSYRNPNIALASSLILPGSGYFYANKPMTGLTALLLNGLFVWAASDAFHAKQYGIFAATSFLGFGWYFGSAVGSWKAVNEFNKRKVDDFIYTKINP